MQPVTFYVVPGIMPLNSSIYLKEPDRREILKNKWRDFSTPPALDQAQVEDPVTLSTRMRGKPKGRDGRPAIYR